MRPLEFRSPPKRILVLSTPGFGDVLLATSLVRSLKRAFPEAAIDVMLHEGREAMLEGNPDVRRTIPVPKRPNVLQFLGIIAKTIRQYDLTITPMSGDRGMFILRLAGRRCVALLAADKSEDGWKRKAISAWADPTFNVPEMLRYMALADLIGIKRCYEVVPPKSEHAGALLDETLGFDWRKTKYAVLHATTHASRKRWTLDGWQAVGRWLKERGLLCVLTGGPADDAAYLQSIVERVGEETVNVAGKLPMSGVSALIEASAVYVGVDTSTTHLAAALGVPTVGIYGPGDSNRWAPWPKNHASTQAPFLDVRGTKRVGNVCLVQAACDCALNYRNLCGKTMPGDSRCLLELPAETVIDAAQEMLDAKR